MPRSTPSADPLVADPVVAGASRLAGGRPGRHASGPLVARPLLVLVPLALIATAAAWAVKGPCRRGWGGTQTGDGYQYTHLCYTDVYALWFAERLDAGAVPYLEHPVEYPPLIGAAMAGVMLVVRAFDGGATAFYDLTAVLLGLAAAVTVATTAGLAGRRRRWDALLVAVAPALLLHAVTNWDLLATALAGGGLLAWARGKPVLAGALLGLGTVTKLYPVLLLVPLLVLGWRAGVLRDALRAAVAAALAAVAVAVPTFLLSPVYDLSGDSPEVVASSPLSQLRDDGVGAFVDALEPVRDDGTVNGAWRFVQLSSDRAADWDSPWFHLDRALPSLAPGPDLLNLLTSGLAVAVVLAVAALGVLAPRRPRVPQLAFLLVVGVLVTAKVFSPQFTLWVLPLAVLALPRWRPLLLWQATEVALFVARMWMFAGQTEGVQGVPVELFGLSVLLRDGALLVLAGLVVRDVLRPAADVVRRDGVDDDPAGGPLDGAADVRGPRRGAAPQADASGGRPREPVVV